MNDGLVGIDENNCIGGGVVIFRDVINGFEVQRHLMIHPPKRGYGNPSPASRHGAVNMAKKDVANVGMSA